MKEDLDGHLSWNRSSCRVDRGFGARLEDGLWLSRQVVQLPAKPSLNRQTGRQPYHGRLRPTPGPRNTIDDTLNTTAAAIQPHEISIAG